ncbi:MAG: hypothetical protein ABSB58_08770 [Gemmatimonadales bacterium]
MRLAATLALALCAAPASAVAQRDVGPARVALFAGARLGHTSQPLIGIAGELELHGALHGTWTLGAAASAVIESDGSYTQYELDARWRPQDEGGLRPYLGAGAVMARSSFLATRGPATTRFGGLGIVGVEIPVVGTTAFVEGLAIENGEFSAQIRGGVRLLLIGR